jgi:hypothetical protein
LQAGGKEIYVGFERRLKIFIPIQKIGQQRQVARVQGIQPRPENVRDFAFVPKRRHLRLTHGQPPAVLNLHVGHGIADRQHAVFRFIPLDYVDKLLFEKTAE